MGCLQASDVAAVEQFKRLFEGVDFRKGLPLAFTATKKGLVTQVDGKEVRWMAGCWAGSLRQACLLCL